MSQQTPMSMPRGVRVASQMAVADGRALAEAEAEKLMMRKRREFEMWREEEEYKFQESMKQRAKERMDVLEHEWVKHEKEREARSQRREAEVLALEKSLKQAAFELEKREQKLVMAEEEVLHQKTVLQRQYDGQVQALTHDRRRVDEDVKHKALMNEKVQKEMDAEILQLRHRLAKADKRFAKQHISYCRHITA